MRKKGGGKDGREKKSGRKDRRERERQEETTVKDRKEKKATSLFCSQEPQRHHFVSNARLLA